MHVAALGAVGKLQAGAGQIELEFTLQQAERLSALQNAVGQVAVQLGQLEAAQFIAAPALDGDGLWPASLKIVYVGTNWPTPEHHLVLWVNARLLKSGSTSYR